MKTTAKGTVLIVDGDAATRRVAEVGLRHAGYRVTVAGSPEQAIWFLEHTSPDAVLTAIQFEGEPLGWELVRLLRARPDGPRVAVIALRTESASREDESVELTDDLVPWPAGVRELELRLHQALVRRRVAEHLTGSGERRMKGDLSELSAIDLLTLVERSQTSGTLEIESSRGPATLWFADGRAIDGHFGRFTGEEAVFQVLIVDAGEFEWTIAPNKHADVIDQSMAETLAENLRRLDEWTRLCDELPDLDQALRVDPQRLQTTRVNLPAEQVALVERCNGRRSIRAVVEESEFDPLLALEVLRYLLDAKVLAPVSAGDVASGSLLVDVGELPPLPSFPEPFPGTSEDLGMDTPLVSGIPEDPGESNEYESFEGLDGLDALDRLDAPEPTGSSEAAADDQEASFLVRESTPKESSAAAYVFRPPRGQGAPSEPPPARRHQSVRIAAVDGRVEPPRGIKQAEAGGELELAPADPRSSRKIGRRRQSILVRRTRPLRLVDRGPAETVRSTRREVMSRSGLIAVGEILVEDPTLAPAAANVEAPSEASAAGPRAEGSVEIVSGAVTPAAGSIAASGIVSGTIITTGTAAISSERSGRWSEEARRRSSSRRASPTSVDSARWPRIRAGDGSPRGSGRSGPADEGQRRGLGALAPAAAAAGAGGGGAHPLRAPPAVVGVGADRRGDRDPPEDRAPTDGRGDPEDDLPQSVGRRGADADADAVASGRRGLVEGGRERPSERGGGGLERRRGAGGRARGRRTPAAQRGGGGGAGRPLWPRRVALPPGPAHPGRPPRQPDPRQRAPLRAGPGAAGEPRPRAREVGAGDHGGEGGGRGRSGAGRGVPHRRGDRPGAARMGRGPRRLRALS
ncbi:MAG: DUF4388 domain-containing protein [Nannocystaceae bacterium]